ncbi:MAG: molybdenum cofactor guanylyltransferase [Spirochaetaceae bacterium]|nr:molybdenum cofactor guanylyltransferase [Spirochaetaceae bacterium]MCF7947840.1 molybdenum cofactor guanylyltransferase [Spirochaetia bacterium]MCF7951648.1 molybdenum cofactor guanylyltransferase [Spirochaetaceae bacterium]
MKPQEEHITAGILAGGRSRRLGRDKAFLNWQGRSLIEWSVMRAKGITSNVYLLAKDRAAYQHLSCPVLPDFYSTSSPLSGILTVGPFVKQWLLLLACDIVLFSDRLLPFLWEQRTPGKAVVVRSKEGLQPLLGLYPVELMGYWEQAYQNGNYKLQPTLQLMPRIEVAEYELPRPQQGEEPFLNINRAADVEQLQRLRTDMRVQ